jgi:hypothetical protein
VLHESNLNLIQPTISLEMPVPSQGHYGFPSFRLLTDFLSSVILLLPLHKSIPRV